MTETARVGSTPPGATMHWIDSHCHLQEKYRPGEATITAVATEAATAGVGGLVCVGTDAQTSREALDLAEVLRHVPGPDRRPFEAWATVGLHPHEAAAGTSEVEAVLERARRERPDVMVAVGECGLDYHYEHSPRARQRDAFAAQIATAHRHGLALVVHARDAWDDTLDVLRAEAAPERTVFHCFTGGPDEARRCLELGACLSFSGIVTFKNASEVRDALALCPSDRLLVETDAPFLAPVPHRGRENRPAWVSVVGEAVARLRGTSPEDLARSTAAATRAVFALVEPST